MLIGEEYKIVTDQYNVILQKKTVPKAKEGEAGKDPYWTTVGYYPTYKSALHGLVDFGVRDLRELQTIVSKIDEIHAMIDELKI